MLASTLLTSLVAALTASCANAAPANGLVRRGFETDIAIQRADNVWLVSGQNIVPDNCEKSAEKTFANAQAIGNPDGILNGSEEFTFTSEADGYEYKVKPNNSGGSTMDVTYGDKTYGTCEKPTPVDCYSEDHPGWQLTKAWYCTYSY